MATREDVVAAIEGTRAEFDGIVSIAGEDVWSRTVYDGWTARELLSHIAASSGVTGFLMAMARNPGATFSERDDDKFNAVQVDARRSRTVAELAEEARGYLDADIARVRAAPEELLAAHYDAPWEVEGRLADIILDSLREHLMVHLGDLKAALGRG